MVVWAVYLCVHICSYAHRWIYLYFLSWLMSVEIGCDVTKHQLPEDEMGRLAARFGCGRS